MSRTSGSGAVELVVVIALLGVLLVVAMPNLSGYRARSAVRAAERQLVADLRASQQRAVAQDKDHAVEFVAGANGHLGYTIKESSTQLWQVTFRRGVYAVASLDGVTFTAGQKSFSFTPTGAVASSASAPAICLDDRNGLKMTIAIAAATGRVQSTQGAGNC